MKLPDCHREFPILSAVVLDADNMVPMPLGVESRKGLVTRAWGNCKTRTYEVLWSDFRVENWHNIYLKASTLCRD